MIRFIDWFIPAAVKDEDSTAYREARLGIIFSVVLIIAAGIYAVLITMLGEKVGPAILIGACTLEFSNLLFLRLTGRFFLSGIFLTAILLFTIFSVNFFWGGWRSPGLIWMVFISVIGTSLSGKTAGYIWLIITLICVVLFYLLDMYGFEFPNELHAGNYNTIQLFMLVGTLTVTWIFVLTYEIFKDYMVHMHRIAKEDIREKAQMFDTILSASPFGISLLRNRRVEWGNDAMRRIFGLTGGEGGDWDARRFYPDDDEYNRVGRILYEDNNPSAIKTVDARMVRKNGEVFDCCIITNPVDPQDTSRGYILAFMDITERKQAEAEIKRLNKQLEERIFDRTMRLKNAQEEIIRKEHKSELADMTTGTLHNVKNILISVKVSTEMLARICSDGSIRGLGKASRVLEENRDNIEDFLLNNPKGKTLIDYYLKIGEIYRLQDTEAMKHLKRLQEKVAAIERIVTAQQGYAGRSELDEVSLEMLIEDALIMHSDTFEAQHIKIIKEFSDIPEITGVKIKLMHIFINLIKNAKEAMINTPLSERKLVFKTRKTDDSIFVHIEDTGCGITPENMKNIFQHGFTTKEDGHGFGLYSCHKYMNEMGGDMHVKSDGQDKGAAFVLQFPAHRNYT